MDCIGNVINRDVLLWVIIIAALMLLFCFN